MMDQLRFTIPQILSLAGLTQCTYLLVYMLFRSGDWKRAALPFLYFFVLGLAFFLDFAAGFVGGGNGFYAIAQWAAWFSGPPLSVLLIIQVTQLSRLPSLRLFSILSLIPAAAIAGLVLAHQDGGCHIHYCPVLTDWLVVTGLAAGLISFLALWTKRDMLRGLQREKAGRERYWLALMLIFVNLFFLTVMLLSLTPVLRAEQAFVIRTFLGLGLVYLAGSSLFRIYPQALFLIEPKHRAVLSEGDREIARKIEDLLALQKIYQEPAYNRADLARELNVPEAAVSRIINLHFGKTFPQLLNEKRIEDARRLLAETDLAVKDVSEQVGFNSLTSFNRVFRERTGMAPGDYRKNNKGI
jgi:AraC-like DNA-binding protein